MKTVKRIGVFETNSSSTHTMVLLSSDEFEKDKQLDKPKYRNYGVISDIKDKLLMACGCCHELFPTVRRRSEWIDDDIDEDIYDEEDYADLGYVFPFDVIYDASIETFVKAYCERTGEDVDTVIQFVNKKNKSGRACHMKFFEEGSLYDAQYDYKVIYDLFDGTPKEVEEKIRNFFDDSTVLCYREFYQGVRWGEDDD